MHIVIELMLCTASTIYRKNMVGRGAADYIMQYQKLLAVNTGKMQSICNLVFIRQVWWCLKKRKDMSLILCSNLEAAFAQVRLI